MPTLYGEIANYFNHEEIKTLSYDLKVDYERFTNYSSKEALARQLVAHLHRSGRIDELIDYVSKRREHVNWAACTLPPLEKETPKRPPAQYDLIRNIQTTWIDGHLKQAVHNAVALELGITYKPDAVSRTWSMELKQGLTQVPIPEDKGVYDVFVENGRSLLILGEPGSGKTFTLLQLAQQLLTYAQEDAAQPIPIILNLSSWAGTDAPLQEWLVEETLLQYQIARETTKTWLQQSQLLLLLDGLDEVAATYRNACVDEINTFVASQQMKIVVCSRIADYEQLQAKLNLSNAILIQPLTVKQIDDYLTNFGDSMAAVREALPHDEMLQELARTPLVLSIMPIAYEGVKADQLIRSTSVAANRQHIFKTYIQRMFERRQLPQESKYDQQQALHWLTQLAHGMYQHKQSIFYIERLQPSWLPKKQLRFYQLILGLICVLIGVLVGGLIVGLSSGLIIELIGSLTAGLIIVLGVGLIIGLIVGLIIGLISPEIRLIEEVTWQRPTRTYFFSQVKDGLIVGLSIVLSSILIVGVSLGVNDGLIVGLIGGLIIGLRTFIQNREIEQRLEPNQGVLNSRRKALRMGLLFGLIGGLSGGLIDGVIDGLIDGLSDGLINGVIDGVIDGVSGGLIGGLSGGLVFGLIGGLILGSLAYGGETFLKHYVLRYVLSRLCILPFPFHDEKLTAYLDEMGGRILLRRVGGGWVFIHRYLLEYFASLHPNFEEE